MEKTKPVRKIRKFNPALLALNLALIIIMINTSYQIEPPAKSSLPSKDNSAPPSPSSPSFSALPQAYISQKEIEPLIDKYSRLYNVNNELMKKMAFCESSYNRFADSGRYKGLYQFHPSTWTATRKRMGLNQDISRVFDAEEAIKTAAFKMAQDGVGAWPVCGRL